MLLVLTSGCDTEQKMTESMLRRQAADKSYAESMAQVRAIITPQVTALPLENIDEIILAYRQIHEARQIYQKAKIVDWDESELNTYQQQLEALNKPLALKSLALMDELIDKSVVFKQKKREVETLPVYDNAVAKQGLYSQLDLFNEDVKTCCTDDINLINQVLSTEQGKYYEVMKLGQNALFHMGRLIRNEVTEQELRQRAQALRETIERSE